MYRYDHHDRQLVQERVAQFRDQVRRRLSGELSEDEFKPLRLMNGLYLQLHAYMLRIAIPYGTLSSGQLRTLARIARRYDRGFGHFTTRQNLQFNWISLADTPDILADLAQVDMHAIQTSGNCIRNVTADHFAGAAADEVDDPRIWCEIVRQWSTLHPEFSFLPRKFKVAVGASAQDRAALRVHDIGLKLVLDAEGRRGFEVMVGGGQGRTPVIAKTIRRFLPQEHLLSYLEAILRLYNRLGRRDNLYKARLKILVDALGPETFAAQVEEEWSAIAKEAVDLPAAEVARIRAHFAPPPFARLPAEEPDLERRLAGEAAFARWFKHNVAAHRQQGYAIVSLSLKPHGGIPGDATADQMDAIADLADRFGFGEIRVTHEQNLALVHVRRRDLYPLWQALVPLKLATANIGLASDIIACPGLDYCSLANARSIPVAQRIALALQELDRLEAIGELKIKISGCINACGHHHVGHIGILGVDKKGEEFYQVTLGGSADETASLGDIVGPAFSAERIVAAVETIIATYLGLRAPGERFLDTYRRVGLDPFKESLYAAH
jgi:sulfite reductase (NADPH) hemoprotein beta-component